ncbi:MAG: hypothetical protein IKR30_06285 [Bacteroidales bacterium]|nr:hypothetical protein [Bacteroidales bacterium]
MDKVTFMKRCFIWTAVIAAVVIAVIGLCFGKVIEGNLFEEIVKWIVMGIGIIAILEVFVYILAPGIYHRKYER